MPNFAPITTGSDGSGQKKDCLKREVSFYKRPFIKGSGGNRGTGCGKGTHPEMEGKSG